MIGARVPRVEDPRLLSGRGLFVADVRLPGMLHAAFVRSPFAHALISGVESAAALAVPGVEAVLTAAEIGPTTLSNARIPGLHATPQPILAADRARFDGEAVALVLADDRYLAEDGADLVEVDYEPLPAVVDPLSRPEGAPPLCEQLEDDVVFAQEMSFGDTEAAFAAAAHVVARTFRSSRCAASPMEGRGCLASYDAVSGELAVWSSTQGPHMLRRKLSEAVGIPENRIRVHIHDVGGGFGQKIPVSPEEVAVAIASRLLGRPVKWIEDRRENLMAAPHSRDQVITAELALDAEGRFLALRSHIVGDAGAYSYNAGTALTEPYLAARMLPGPYRIASYSYRVSAHLTNKAPIAPYRGVGMVAAQTARELLIDEAARRLGRDRLELRRRNLVAREDQPYRSAIGLEFDSNSFVESLERAAALLDPDWVAARRREAEGRGRRLGVGYSPYVEPTGSGRQMMAQVYGAPHVENDSARVALDPSGTVTVAFGTTSQGQGQETSMAQVAADVLGARMDQVRVSLTDTDAAPLSLSGTRASRSAVVSGGAVGLAAAELREKLARAAAEVLECAPEDLVFEAGRIHVAGSEGNGLTFKEVVRAARERPEVMAAAGDPQFSVTRFYDAGPAFANACVAAAVELDPETGGLRVLRLAVAHDSGTEINPLLVEGQLLGGMVQGLGGALLERIVYDGSGSLRTASFMDYLLPTAAEVPEILLETLSSPAPGTWRGIKGVGESGAIGTPAAIATAAADAMAGLGGSVTSLPLWPEHVLAALSQPVSAQRTGEEP